MKRDYAGVYDGVDGVAGGEMGGDAQGQAIGAPRSVRYYVWWDSAAKEADGYTPKWEDGDVEIKAIAVSGVNVMRIRR
ncbi:MAG TPA: hypothetical protein EYP10_12460 [Armatimonadetes bacterium]|nr:hypothetical protein [Armatimonadota bacterium]